jgi:hypothetical protein
MFLDNIFDFIMWMPWLPLLLISGGVGVYLGLKNNRIKKEKQEELKEAEKKLMKEYGAASGKDFQQMVAEARTADVMEGETANYKWKQDAQELDLFVRISPNTKSKDIQCDFTSQTMRLTIDGEVRVEGSFYARVMPDDCNWQLDGSGENRVIWIILHKAKATSSNKHWRCVLQGDVEIGKTQNDTKNLTGGPSVHTVNSNDPASMVRAMEQLKQRKSNMS